jgi:hypothetical protein
MKPWSADAIDIGEITELKPEEDLVITPSIKKFINTDRDSMFYAVAPKGFGKTLLLMYKRLIYQQKHKKGEMYFIPNDNPVDRNITPIPFGLEKINILRNNDNWVNIWSFCISLSIIKNLKIIYGKKADINKKDEMEKLIKYLPIEIQVMIENPLFVTPYGYLSHILGLSHKNIIEIIHKQYLLIQIIKEVRSSIAIFIDNTDQLFGEHLKVQNDTDSFSGELSPDIWYASQIGLMIAVWTLCSLNRHIKIFTSIRKEAFLKLFDSIDTSLQIYGSTLDIEYTKRDLYEIFIKNIMRMNKDELTYPTDFETDPLYAFLGLNENKITNAWVGNSKEFLFDYIYRHTLKRPRDLMIIGAQLSMIRKEERTEENIRIKVNKSATKIVEEYLAETKSHMHFPDIENFFNLINSNILTKNEVRDICKEFNKSKTCGKQDCKKCEKTHVFCNLYKIGLLGVVRKDLMTNKYVQMFLPPGNKLLFESKTLPHTEYYLIHPALNSLIYDIRLHPDEIQLNKPEKNNNTNPRTIVGDGYEWKNPRIYRSTRFCSFISKVCEKDQFLDLHGVFLASSYGNRDIIDELSEKLKKLNIRLEIDTWTTREEHVTGRVFSDEVCPKILKNFWILAEISDFNPNVFFECGFGIGLGRNVTFILNKAKKIKSINSKFENLYTSYESLDELVNKLEKDRVRDNDKLSMDITSLYSIPRLLKHISKYDSPENRDKNNNIYVLSFNHEQDIIRKLLVYGCKIVDVNNLNQNFLSVTLIEELINAKALLVNLNGKQGELNNNRFNDSQLMCIAGICVSQGVPVRFFQNNANFYIDVHDISLTYTNHIIEFINSLPI